MTFQYDVKSAFTANSTAQLVSYRTRLKNVIFVGNGSAGSVILYDTASNSATGNVLWQGKTSTGVQPFQVIVPGEGILAQNGIYVSTANINSLTICYG
jgi:hypothetical protein